MDARQAVVEGVASDSGWFDPAPALDLEQRWRRESRYLTMRDGALVAITVTLPHGPGPFATIVRQTRYWRGQDVRAPFDKLPGLLNKLENVRSTRHALLARGFAWVDVCARASGASPGVRPYPWSAEEVRDGAEVLNWIVAQPWSDGRCGTVGVSYEGAAAYLLASNRHPALRAAAPRQAPHDVFADVAFPGGVHLSWFTKHWGMVNRMLDAHDFGEVLSVVGRLNCGALAQWFRERGQPMQAALMERLASPKAAPLLRAAGRQLVRGPAPVPGREYVMARAIEDHRANYDVHEGALRTRFRDDKGMSQLDPDATIDTFSPHSRADDVQRSGVPQYCMSGWFDGAYQRSTIIRYLTHKDIPGTKLVLGPWDHSGTQNISPDSPAWQTAFDHGEALARFFGHHVRGEDTGIGQDAPVRYFTMGEERWKAAQVWPPPAERRVAYLGGGGQLVWEAGEAGRDVYQVDLTHGTGRASRWRTILALSAPVHYPDRRSVSDKIISYTAAPFKEFTEVTGHPIVTLWVDADREDFDIFCYMEIVRRDGRVQLLTEGNLRASHRKLSQAPYPSPVPYHSYMRCDAQPVVPGEPIELVFDMLPTSYRFSPGESLRISVAGTDADSFAAPAHGAARLGLHRGGARASRVELPVVRS
jgi:putative CocE/NonD family hydrolase